MDVCIEHVQWANYFPGTRQLNAMKNRSPCVGKLAKLVSQIVFVRSAVGALAYAEYNGPGTTYALYGVTIFILIGSP